MKTWPETDQDHADFIDWRYEASNGDTILGFRDWIAHRDEAEAGESRQGDAAAQHPWKGAATRESNCTAGLMCPECGWTGRFTITALVTCDLTDNGVDEYSGCEYEGDSPMECHACPFVGELNDFTLPDGPDWGPGPAEGTTTATVPSPSHGEWVVLTVDADAQWSVTREVTPQRQDGGPRLAGAAVDMDTAKRDALTAWRSCTTFDPA